MAFLSIFSDRITQILKYTFTLITCVLQIFIMGWLGDRFITSVRYNQKKNFFWWRLAWIILMANSHEFLHSKRHQNSFSLFSLSTFESMLLQSTGIADGVYNGHWIKADVRFQKCLILVIQRSQKPLTLTAYKFTAASLSSVASVNITLFSSFSYVIFNFIYILQVLSTSWKFLTLLKTAYTELWTIHTYTCTNNIEINEKKKFEFIFDFLVQFVTK